MTTTAEAPAAEETGTDRDAFLSVRDLRVRFSTEDGTVKAVDGLSFDVARGRTLGIVGESGSGKSVTNLAILGLHNRARTAVEGSIILEGRELTALKEKELEGLRGRKMAMIFQDPLTALSPYYTIGEQLSDAYRKHTGASRKAARKRAVEMLDRVGIPQPDQRAASYPHQFSGGMRQRAVIAMALMCDPELLIADEPTTALDVTVQAQILDLLTDLQREFGTAIILITHDLGVVAQSAHDVMVMYGGRCVEKGTVTEVLTEPRHPYTWGLLGSMPTLDGDPEAGLTPIEGTPPSLLNPPSGCAFHPRCAFVDRVGDPCVTGRPGMTGGAHAAACHIEPRRREEIFVRDVLPQLQGSTI